MTKYTFTIVLICIFVFFLCHKTVRFFLPDCACYNVVSIVLIKELFEIILIMYDE